MTRENKFWEHYFTFLKAASIIIIFFWHFDSLILLSKFNLFGNNGFNEIANSPRGFWWSASRVPLSFGYQIARFFIIASGFGLYLSYLKNRTSWKTFFMKRFFRVIILYWIVLILWFIFDDRTTLAAFIQHFFLIHVFTKYVISFGQFWFVGYIFQLYLIFPLIVWVFRNKWAKWGLFISSFFLHQLLVQGLGLVKYEFTGMPLTIFLSMFLLGMLLAETYHNRPDIMEKLQDVRYSVASLFALSFVIYLLNNSLGYHFYIEHLVFVLLFFSLITICHVCMKIPVVWNSISTLSYAAFVLFLTQNLIIIKATKWLSAYGIMPMHHGKYGQMLYSDQNIVYVYAFVIFLHNCVIAYYIQTLYNRAFKRFNYSSTAPIDAKIN